MKQTDLRINEATARNPKHTRTIFDTDTITIGNGKLMSTYQGLRKLGISNDFDFGVYCQSGNLAVEHLLLYLSIIYTYGWYAMNYNFLVQSTVAEERAQKV